MKNISVFIYIILPLLILTSKASSQTEATIGFLNKSALNFDIKSADTYETVFIIKQVSQSLLDQDHEGKIIPSIAQFWTITPDMKSYRFQLRDSIKFSNGEIITAEDVIFSLEEVRSSKTNPISTYLKRIQSIKAINEKTIEIVLKKPWFGFLTCLTSGLVPIFSKNLIYSKKNLLAAALTRQQKKKCNIFLSTINFILGSTNLN